MLAWSGNVQVGPFRRMHEQAAQIHPSCGVAPRSVLVTPSLTLALAVDVDVDVDVDVGLAFVDVDDVD